MMAKLVRGGNKIRRHFKDVKKLPGLQARLQEVGELVADTMRSMIQPGPPSKPGEPPSNQTSALKAGIKVRKATKNSVTIVSTDPASASLEFGNSTTAARPFARPAAKKTLKTVARILGTAVDVTGNRRRPGKSDETDD